MRSLTADTDCFMWIKDILLLAIVLLGIGPKHSDAQSPVELRGGIGLTTTSYDEEIVDHFNLAGRGWGFQATFAPRFYNYVGILLETGWEYWGQVCLGSPCETDRTSTSSVMASLGVGLASPVLFVNDRNGPVGFGLTLNGGHEWIKSGLSQDNCLNCTINDLDVKGGFWFEPGLDLIADPNVVIGFAYRVYESNAGVNSRITIRVVHRSD